MHTENQYSHNYDESITVQEMYCKLQIYNMSYNTNTHW